MSDQQLSEQESLDIIRQMIDKAKNQFSENGHLYLLWGWVIFVCCIGQYILINYFHSDKNGLIWLLTWVALAYQTYYLRKSGKHRKVKTYTDEVVGYVWIAFIASFLLCSFSLAFITNGDLPLYSKLMGPVFLALYGVPTFLSGIILRFSPLKWGGLVCWTLSLIACFTPYQFQLLLLALAVVIAWIIPGYLLRGHFKSKNQ